MSRKLSFKNLQKNWWFIPSSAAFFILSIDRLYLFYGYISAAAAILFSAFFAMYKENIFKRASDSKEYIIVLSVLSSIAVAINSNPENVFYELNDMLTIIQAKLSFDIHSNLLAYDIIPRILKLLCIPFCFTLFTEAYKFIENIFRTIMSAVTKKDLILTALFCTVLLGFTAVAFCKTSVFFGIPDKYDLVYTSDISQLLENYCYISVGHGHNDIRQPLFAIFSAPFFAPIYIFAHFFVISKKLYGFLTMIMNVLLMSVSFLLISLCVSKEQKKRSGILILLFFMYAAFLFGIVIEQYQSGLFWLSAYLFYCINIKDSQATKEILYIGASGTLTTNLITFPLMLSEKSIKDNLIILRDTVCMGIFAICFSGRLAVLLSAYDRLNSLRIFTAVKISFATKLLRFFAFITHCFIAPNTYISNGQWLLGEATTPAVISGIVIFAICFAGFLLNKNSPLAKTGFCWIIYSFIILCIIGWGVPENGSVLYSLYFGWAYCVLIHLFINKVFEKTKNGAFVLELILAGLMLIYNIPKILEMINTLALYYPA